MASVRLPAPPAVLPGALDGRAFGAVFYLMAHTVCRITPAIFSFSSGMSGRAWDPWNALLADGTWGAHLTIAWCTGNAWCSWRSYVSRLSNALVSFQSRWSLRAWRSEGSLAALSADLSGQPGCAGSSRITWRAVFSWRSGSTRRCRLYWRLHARQVVGHSLVKHLDDLLADEVLDFVIIDNSIISW